MFLDAPFSADTPQEATVTMEQNRIKRLIFINFFYFIKDYEFYW